MGRAINTGAGDSGISQVKTVTPRINSMSILPDDGYNTLSRVDLTDFPYEVVDSTHVLGNPYGDTAVIGVAEIIPIIQNGTIVNPDF